MRVDQDVSYRSIPNRLMHTHTLLQKDPLVVNFRDCMIAKVHRNVHEHAVKMHCKWLLKWFFLSIWIWLRWPQNMHLPYCPSLRSDETFQPTLIWCRHRCSFHSFLQLSHLWQWKHATLPPLAPMLQLVGQIYSPPPYISNAADQSDTSSTIFAQLSRL